MPRRNPIILAVLFAFATASEGCTCKSDSAPQAKAAEDAAPAPRDAAPRKGPRFVVVPGLAEIAHIATGYDHSCAVDKQGKVSCWGRNDAGQLGDGTSINQTSPRAVKLPFAAVHIAAGRDRTCAASAEGKIACWGKGVGKEGSSLTPAIAGKVRELTDMAVGFGFTCVVANQRVQCFGLGDHGELGPERKVAAKPTKIAGTDGAIDVTASRYHACATLQSGEVVCWGNSPAAGFKNDNEWTAKTTHPRAVERLPAASAIVTTSSKSCAIVEDGHVWCWGRGVLAEEFARALRTPVEHATISGAVEVAIAAVYGCMRDEGGIVSCWGAFGPGGHVPSPRPIDGLGPVTEMDSGHRHTCALRKDGTVACFGDNQWGQLGNGTWGGYIAPY